VDIGIEAMYEEKGFMREISGFLIISILCCYFLKIIKYAIRVSVCVAWRKKEIPC
jgi:hypothetical protein